jgi:HSP20 family protein
MIHWLTNPRRERNHLPANANRLFSHFENLLEDFWAPATRNNLAPAMDVVETDQEYRVLAELPGVDPKDVDVAVDGNELTLRGTFGVVLEEKEATYHWRERRVGEFMRTLTLPANVMAEQVKATFRHGILELTLPKREDAKKRSIKVDVVK